MRMKLNLIKRTHNCRALWLPDGCDDVIDFSPLLGLSAVRGVGRGPASRRRTGRLQPADRDKLLKLLVLALPLPPADRFVPCLRPGHAHQRGQYLQGTAGVSGGGSRVEGVGGLGMIGFVLFFINYVAFHARFC